MGRTPLSKAGLWLERRMGGRQGQIVKGILNTQRGLVLDLRPWGATAGFKEGEFHDLIRF